LDDKDIFVFIDDEAAKKIAFSIDDAEGRGVGKVFLPDSERRANSFLEKALVYFDTLRRKDANVNPGPGVIEANAEKALTMVFHLDQLAVRSRVRKTENRAVINPGMTGQDAIGLARL